MGASAQTPGQHLGPVPRGPGRSGSLWGVMDTGLGPVGVHVTASPPTARDP